MEMQITIRKALSDDAYDYTDCFIRCLQTAYKGIASDEFLNNLSVQREQRVQRFRESLTNTDLDLYCVKSDNEMIGFLTIHRKDAEIWAIYLLEEFRSKGSGKEMLDFAIGELKNIGHKNITLWVFEKNNGARRFYEKNGFCFDGTKRETTNYGGLLVQLRYALTLN